MQAREVMMEKDGVQTEVRNNSSVQTMEALGWKVVGEVKVDRSKLDEALAALPGIHTDPDYVVSGMRSFFGEVFTIEDEAKVRELVIRKAPVADPVTEVKPPIAGTQKDAKDMTKEELEAKYSGMTKADLAELLEARGIKFGQNETKAELIAHLVEGK